MTDVAKAQCYPCLTSDYTVAADSDIRYVDLDSAAETVHSQVIEVSVHQGRVEALPAIDAGRAPTMDNLVPAPQCVTLMRRLWRLHPISCSLLITEHQYQSTCPQLHL